MSKGQISIEYLIIIGVSFAILIPTSLFLYNYSRASNDDTVRAYVNNVGEKLKSGSENIYGIAEGSLMTTEFNYPKNIQDIYILNNNEIVIRYQISGGINEAIFFPKVNVSGPYNLSNAPCNAPCGSSTISDTKPSPGKHNIKFISKKNFVLINITK